MSYLRSGLAPLLINTISNYGPRRLSVCGYVWLSQWLWTEERVLRVCAESGQACVVH